MFMSIVCSNLDLIWANGKVLFHQLNFVVSKSKKTALVGQNGVGKSSIFRLIVKDLEPTNGSIQADGSLCCFWQEEVPENVFGFEYLASHWEWVPKHMRVYLEELIGDVDLNKKCSAFSGGEWARLRLFSCFSSPADILLLDEPSNHLDLSGRKLLNQILQVEERQCLLISHDSILLKAMDEILEINTQGASLYGGNYHFYREQKTLEKENYCSELNKARNEKRRLKNKKKAEAQRQEKKQSRGSKAALRSGKTKLESNFAKEKAAKTKAREKKKTLEKEQKLDVQLRKKYESNNDLQSIDFEIPKIENNKKQVLVRAEDLNLKIENKRLFSKNLNFQISTGETMRLTGGNGSGKSSLCKVIAGNSQGLVDIEGNLFLREERLGYLDQNLEFLDKTKNSIQELMDQCDLHLANARSALYRLGFDEIKAFQPIYSLSSGERLRLSILKLMVGEFVPRLLILDELTNHLDFESLNFLKKTLKAYNGALLLVSHDDEFVKGLNFDHCLDLDQ